MINLYRKIWVYQILLLFPSFILPQSKDNVRSHTEYLSSDRLEGRGTGSPGIRLAAAYIAKQFKTIGLEKSNGESYYQEFSFPGQKEPELNVVGFIKAIKPSEKSIVFTAHYDAYGIVPIEGQKDSICNGAQDNAVGVAALIELARTYANERAPRHNIVFVATAGEEFGQYGSQNYVRNPVFPVDGIIICLNVDGFNVYGPREDYFIFPRQGIDYVDEIEAILEPMDWHYNSPDWVDSMNTSFDTASFLSKGIPALTLWTGTRLKGGKTAAPVQLGSIHSPDDEITVNWNWEGVDDHIAIYKAISDYFMSNPEGIQVTDPSLFIIK